MPLHPEAQEFLDSRAAQGVRNPEDMTVQDARDQSVRTNTAVRGPDVARVRDLEIPAPIGSIPARLYYPNLNPTLPVVVFFHGGGFVMGSLDVVDATARQWANGSGCLVVSVNYRHAPENKFPAAADDAYAATRWVSEHAAEIGADPARLAVAGMSAGGGLAATTTLMAREKGTPPIAFQVLWVPVLNAAMDTPSFKKNAEGYGLTARGMRWFWGHYLADPSDGNNPYASPLRAADFSNLPAAIVLAAEFDPLCDEDTLYAEKLRAAGVPVEYHCYEGMIHGFLGTIAFNDAMAAIRKALRVE
jgi:acetyl esterase